MPPQATKDWISLLEEEARERDISVDTSLRDRFFHFKLGDDPGLIGKVRISKEKSRNYADKHGQKNIWHRYDREKERIQDGSKRNVVNITLDVWDKDEYDPEEHHFIFLTEQMIIEETYSRGDQEIDILGDGLYGGPLAKYIDDWDAIFEYATGASNPTPTGKPSVADGEVTQSQGELDESDPLDDTSGTVWTGERSEVQVSESFKQAVYNRFDHQCPVTGIKSSELLTVSHLLRRADRPDLAEEIENVLLLSWTHHFAFDAGLWTFDESGRLWIMPGFETASPYLEQSLIDHHGEKIDTLGQVGDKYIEQRNKTLDWWPPR